MHFLQKEIKKKSWFLHSTNVFSYIIMQIDPFGNSRHLFKRLKNHLSLNWSKYLQAKSIGWRKWDWNSWRNTRDEAADPDAEIIHPVKIHKHIELKYFHLEFLKHSNTMKHPSIFVNSARRCLCTFFESENTRFFTKLA